MAGELARDRDRDDRAPFAAPLERLPALMQSARALVGARPDRRRLPLAAPLERNARPQRSPLVLGRFDEQSACVRVAGFGDCALAASLAG